MNNQQEKAMGQIILEANTNSNQEVPEFAVFNGKELDAIVERYSHAVNWGGDNSLLSVKVNTLPECQFSDESGTPIELSKSLEGWEQVVTDVSEKGLFVIFVHNQDGSELFFEYTVAQG